jgi:serine phosphatase RsbU (regulator of sigma subunit)
MNGEEKFRGGLGLKAKFLTWLVIFILVIMIIVYLYVAHHERTILSKEIRLRGEAICNNLAAAAEDLLVMKDDLALIKLVNDTKNKNKGVIYCFIIDTERKIWAHTDISLVQKKYMVPSGLKELGNKPIFVQEYKTEDGIFVFEIAIPVKVGKSIIGEVHLAISQEAIKNAVAQARKGIISVSGGIICVGIIGILVLVSFIIGSLGKVTEDIEAIGEGNLDRKIYTRRKDEIGRIAYAVKTMAQKLKKARAELIEKERIKKEMQIARKIQHSLLPSTLPHFPGFRIDAFYQAAMEIGGDYYDFLDIDTDHFGIVVADVSGKGIAGSLIMTMVRTIMRIEAFKNPSPHNLLSMTNFILMEEIPEKIFITLFYVTVDTRSGEIIFSCAGHNPAYLFNPEKTEIIPLKPKGPPLGIQLIDGKEFAKRLHEEKRVLRSGETLLLYTDGVTEAMNRSREQFGEEKLKNLLKFNGSLNPTELKRILRSEIDTFTGGEPQSDDITFVILQRE